MQEVMRAAIHVIH